jgi:Microbial transglutaminase
VGTREYLAGNASRVVALQRSAGNGAIGQMLAGSATVQRANELTVQRDRAEVLSAFNDEVRDGHWAEAAVRLNGFNDVDISGRLKELGYDKREKLLAACPEWNYRVRNSALDMNFTEDLKALTLERASVVLNGFSDADMAIRLAKVPPDRLLELLVHAPNWNKRVLEAGLKLQPKEAGHREWPMPKFIAIWNKLHDTKIGDKELDKLWHGCIGITTLNLDDDNPNPPLGLSFDTLARAREIAREINKILEARPTVQQYTDMMLAHPKLNKLKHLDTALPAKGEPADWTAVVFSKRFYANQNPDWEKAKKADTKSFKPDPKTGQVDMDGYKYHGRPDPSKGKGQEMIPFDYGWYDEATNTWFHANQGGAGMVVYQSTLEYYSQPIVNFDRQTFVVAMAKKH